MTATTKIHFGFTAYLFCSGRSMLFAHTTDDVEDVTCGSCIKKLERAAA